MSNYINGVSYPRILVKNSLNEIIDTIDLDLCGANGLTEEYTEDFKRIELESGRFIDYDTRGSRITFTLDYSEYIKKANLFLIERIFFYNSIPEYTLLLYPRLDVLARNFEVRLLDGTFSLGILTGGVNAKGHKYPVLKFITATTGSKLFIDPDLLYLPLAIKSL